MQIRTIFISCLAIIAAGISSLESRGPSPAEKIARMLIGNFDSAAQAKADSNYYNISLVSSPIWEDRRDGHWIYVEQALATKLDAPYRQRVYHIQLTNDGGVRSDIYALPEPARFIGKVTDDAIFKQITPDSLIIRKGCGVLLYPDGDGTYKGSTVKGECAGTFGDAAYVTTEVTLQDGELWSWDRGFNEQDEQVWGATDGPYHFIRK